MTGEMNNNQHIEVIDAVQLLEKIADTKTDGYRLSQICASKIDDNLEILYVFVKDSLLKNYKVIIGCKEPELPSITGVYLPAFIYENEMHDLFGIKFKNLQVDYGGHFFKLSEETPWNPKEDRGGEE